MINTVLFDLDGTLLSMDTELFIKQYFTYVAEALKDYMSKEEVIKSFWESTYKVIKSNDGSLTNEEVFFDDFFSKVKIDKEVLLPVLNEFYANEFGRLKVLAKSQAEMIEAVKILKEKKYELIIATNPIFPAVAVKQRIEWADIDINDFEYVTTFENSCFTKPNPNYYVDILANLEKESKHCLMVGNHVEEDMIAKTVGLSTYLITDHILGDPNDNSNVDNRGDYREFLAFVISLPSLA